MLLRPLAAGLLALVFFGESFVSGESFAQKSPEIFSQIDTFTAGLSEITGWPVRRKVPSEVVSKAKFESYIQAQTRSTSHQKEEHAEEAALKMLGLVPANFDLAKQTEDLLGEQAAAYY